jgi:hypothetical protein
MTLDPRVKRLLDMLALGSTAAGGSLDAAAQRLGFKALTQLSRVTQSNVAVEERGVEDAAGLLPARQYMPAGAGEHLLPGLVFFHGERFGVAGDSSGGTLTTVVAAAFADAAANPLLRLQVLLCPVLDQATMDRDLAGHLPDRVDAAADPRVSPLRRADLTGLCPALIHAAAFDPLRDEGQDYAAGLAAARVPVRHTCHPGMIHHFAGFSGLVPYASTALAAIGAEIRAILQAGP